jgi:3-hydroxyacyl-[acyl-carrier-protein] dehydratase/UDP-3-O-[3-hydroxymyristoyl] N-acetylglucosamine deacetylase/3-hydroxyacyl-[acyl-carrier-protein] dehydratase
LSAIHNAKFRKAVIPGDQLRLEAELTKLRKKVAFLKGKAYVDGEIVAEGEIMASLLRLEELNE